MSTILDALKRLEEKTRARHERWMPGAMQGRRKRGAKRWHGPALAIGLGVLVAGAVGAAYWSYGKWDRKVQVKEDASLNPASTESLPGPPSRPVQAAPKPKKVFKTIQHPLPSGEDAGAAKSLPVEKPKVEAAAPSSVDVQALPKRNPKPPSANNLQKSPQRDAPRRPPRQPVMRPRHTAAVDSATAGPVPERRSGLGGDRPGSDLTAKPPVRQASPSPSFPARDPYANAEVFTKDELDLQAISWADQASTRVTIINGQILREGQTVDGYAVVQIRPDHVILSKDASYWKLGYDN